MTTENMLLTSFIKIFNYHAIRGKDLHFCIMELGIRPNCSDYLWSYTKLVDFLVDYLEVSYNLQFKTTRLLSLKIYAS